MAYLPQNQGFLISLIQLFPENYKQYGISGFIDNGAFNQVHYQQWFCNIFLCWWINLNWIFLILTYFAKLICLHSWLMKTRGQIKKEQSIIFSNDDKVVPSKKTKK